MIGQFRGYHRRLAGFRLESVRRSILEPLEQKANAAMGNCESAKMIRFLPQSYRLEREIGFFFRSIAVLHIVEVLLLEYVVCIHVFLYCCSTASVPWSNQRVTSRDGV